MRLGLSLNIPSEMEVAPRYTLLTHFTLLTLSSLFILLPPPTLLTLFSLFILLHDPARPGVNLVPIKISIFI